MSGYLAVGMLNMNLIPSTPYFCLSAMTLMISSSIHRVFSYDTDIILLT